MTMRPFTDARGGLNHLVDAQIGRAFPVVHKVYQHLDAIEYVAQVYEAGRARDIVLRTNHTKEWIEWQYKGEAKWTILFKFSDLLGADIADVVAAEAALAAELEQLRLRLNADMQTASAARDAALGSATAAQTAKTEAVAAKDAAVVAKTTALAATNQGAQHLADIEAQVVAAEVLAQATETAAASAQDASAAASSSAQAAEVSAQAAVGSVVAADAFADAAGVSAGDAATSAQAAAGSANAAAVSAAEALDHKTGAGIARDAADASATAAAQAEAGALGAAGNATLSASGADISAQAAQDSADAAAASAVEAGIFAAAADASARNVSAAQGLVAADVVAVLAAKADAESARDAAQVAQAAAETMVVDAAQVAVDRAAAEATIATVTGAADAAAASALAASQSKQAAATSASEAADSAVTVAAQIDGIDAKLDAADALVVSMEQLRDQTLAYKNAARDSTTNAVAVADDRAAVEALMPVIAGHAADVATAATQTAAQHAEAVASAATATAAATAASTSSQEAAQSNEAAGLAQAKAELAATEATSRAAAALASEQAAAASQQAAADSETAAEAAKVIAVASAEAARVSVLTIGASEDAAAASAAAALASATAAAGSAQMAGTSETSIAGMLIDANSKHGEIKTMHGDAVAMYDDLTAKSETVALQHTEIEALAAQVQTNTDTTVLAEQLARAWADKMGGEVEPGKFSARYWAQIAASAATGGVVYMGTWDASSGIYPATPENGHLYKVSVAGGVDGVSYSVKDMAIFNGTSWDKIDSTDAVTSVAGRVGAVVLTKGDVGLGNVDNTSDADKPVSTATQAALDGKAAASHGHAVADVTGLQSAMDTLTSHTDSSSNPHGVTKVQVGLGDVDNTSDANKPISSATQAALITKEGAIASGTTTQYWRGDKTWRDFATDVRAAVLAGLSTATNVVVVATDTVLAAIGKLQAQVSSKVSKTGDTMTGALNWAPAVDVASAATTQIGLAASNRVRLTGTTAITSLGTIAAGVCRTVTFAGALTLTHNATSLILPGGANIATAAGDVAEFESLGSGNWRCTGYMRASGQALVVPSKATPYTDIAANTTAVPYERYRLTASLDLTLPASPADGVCVDVVNTSGTTTARILRNAQSINGLAEDLTIDANYAAFRLVYRSGYGWFTV